MAVAFPCWSPLNLFIHLWIEGTEISLRVKEAPHLSLVITTFVFDFGFVCVRDGKFVVQI